MKMNLRKWEHIQHYHSHLHFRALGNEMATSQTYDKHLALQKMTTDDTQAKGSVWVPLQSCESASQWVL